MVSVFGLTTEKSGWYYTDDGGCVPRREGCMLPSASNFDSAATRDDEIARILGRSGTCPTCRCVFRVEDCSTLEGAAPGDAAR